MMVVTLKKLWGTRHSITKIVALCSTARNWRGWEPQNKNQRVLSQWNAWPSWVEPALKAKRVSYDKEATSSELTRKAITMNLNKRVNNSAQTLNFLHAKLSGGDVIAQGLQYHAACLADLYNRERSYLRAIKRLGHRRGCPPIGILLRPSHISSGLETTRSSEVPSVFRLADIVHLYAQCLEQLSNSFTIIVKGFWPLTSKTPWGREAHMWADLQSQFTPIYGDHTEDVISICPHIGMLVCPYMEISVSVSHCVA